MPVASLVVEDGSIVAGANTYGTLDGLQQYAVNQGVDLTSMTSDTLTVFMFKAIQYLNSFENQYIGQRLSHTQSLSWPRKIWNKFSTVDIASIPTTLVLAQYQLVLEQVAGNELMPTITDAGNLKKSIIGPITKEYFAPNIAGPAGAATFTLVNSYLALLLRFGAGKVRTVRG